MMEHHGKWVERYDRRPSASMRLFCFPHAGGAAQVFRSWSNALPGDVEVCPIQLPGRWTRMKEAPMTDLVSCAKAAAEGMAPFLDRPFALFGHSLGALVAFEVVRALRRGNAPSPNHLFVSARTAPHLALGRKPAHKLPDKQLIDFVGYRYGGIPVEILREPELLEMMVPILRSDMQMYETYVFSSEDPIETPIQAVGGIDDQLARREEMELWSEHTSGRFELELFQGGHFYMTSSSKAFFKLLTTRLEACVGEGG